MAEAKAKAEGGNAAKQAANVEAIMTGERVMDVATGSRKAESAPYEMIGDADSPTPTAESYAKETAPRPDPREKKGPEYDEKAFNAYVSKYGKLKTFEATLEAFLKHNLSMAKAAVAKLSKPRVKAVRSTGRKGGKKRGQENGNNRDDDQDG